MQSERGCVGDDRGPHENQPKGGKSMPRIPLPLAGTLLALGLAVTACEQQDEVATREMEREVPPATVPQPAPAAPAVVDEVQEDLVDARSDFLERDYDDAAEDLHEAAEKVRREAQTAPAEVRDELVRAADDLEGVAADVQAGTITTVEEFDRSLASTSATLARHHFHRAREAWGRRDLQAAGRELEAAARSVGNGLAHLGQSAETEIAEAVRGARELGGRLAQGAEAAPEDVENAFQRLEQAIERFVQEARTERS